MTCPPGGRRNTLLHSAAALLVSVSAIGEPVNDHIEVHSLASFLHAADHRHHLQHVEATQQEVYMLRKGTRGHQKLSACTAALQAFECLEIHHGMHCIRQVPQAGHDERHDYMHNGGC
jgi:hypothetical protein